MWCQELMLKGARRLGWWRGCLLDFSLCFSQARQRIKLRGMQIAERWGPASIRQVFSEERD